jgi:hypothetical protein
VVSYDGVTWTHTQGNIIQSANIARWTGSNYIIAGQDPSNSILVKQNGGYADWHLGHNLYSDTILDLENNAEFTNTIVFPRSKMLSGASHSFDGGLTWTDGSFNMKKVQTNGKIWVGITQSSTIAWSRDGINWIDGGPDITANDVCWNGSMWVAVGQNIYYSYDGIYWI